MSKRYKVAEVISFGLRLIETRDLDPVYCALVRAKLPEKQLRRLLLAYFCFYHLGSAAYISEREGDEYWRFMEIAARNKLCNPDELNPDLPVGKWPRGAERRHFRGDKCVKAIEWMAEGNLFGSGTFARDCPEGLIDTLIDGYDGPRIPLGAFMGRIQTWPMFGPWIAFKAADILERVLGVEIIFPNDLALIYDEPRKALNMLDAPAEEANQRLLAYFANVRAPPGIPKDRWCNIQEVETICCKWKAGTTGHYWIGKDIHEIRKALAGWGETAAKLMKAMPQEVNTGLFA